MKRFSKLARTIILCATVISSFLTAASSAQVPVPDSVLYPEGYREWMHVKSALITPSSRGFKRFGGLHHIYANAKAVEGYRTGVFAEGAVIVADFLETQEKDGDVSEGKRRFIDVMLKDSKRFAQTGGWGFEEFSGDSKTERTLTNPAKECFQCHTAKQESGFVFSSLRK
ncbi:MAG: cytochrome P460 family protein [Candidatus Kapaibacteriota bacterium]